MNIIIILLKEIKTKIRCDLKMNVDISGTADRPHTFLKRISSVSVSQSVDVPLC